MKRLLDFDATSGIATWHDYDPVTNKTTIETVQDCEPYLEKNKRQANDPSRKSRGIKESFLKIATIPIGVQHIWMKRYGLNIYDKDSGPRVRRLLNDPEWRYLRTITGRA